MSITVSGFSEMLLMPCLSSQSAKSLWSDGPWPQMPTYLPWARQALMAILRNLFRNAAEHAAPATLRVSLDGAVLVVADDGPGIAAEDRAFVFERYYRGRLADAPGAPADPGGDYRRGLGLAIARELAVANGWQLDVAPSVPRGTQFRLDLQESGPR